MLHLDQDYLSGLAGGAPAFRALEPALRAAVARGAVRVPRVPSGDPEVVRRTRLDGRHGAELFTGRARDVERLTERLRALGPEPDALLPGRWTVERTLEDAALGSGTFAGEALFAPDGDGLVWRERGRLRLGAYEGPAARTLRIEPDGGGWLVRFADGRPFHALDLRDGACAVAHACGEDRYEGEYRVTGPDELEVRWRVRGPAKDGRITSVYRRA